MVLRLCSHRADCSQPSRQAQPLFGARRQKGRCAAWTAPVGWRRPHPLHAAPAPASAVAALAVAQEAQAQPLRTPDPAPLTDGPSTEAPSAAALAGSAEAPFVWTKHWWPLMPASYLRPDRPNAVTLMGLPLVAWRDATGSWRVFKDQCPHRLAPLSEGRLEADGTLSCSYHGWRFGGGGACTRVPQALDAAAEAAALCSKRSCATAYPARLEAGMLWVWPDQGPSAAADAADCPLPISSYLRDRAASIEQQQQAYDMAKGGGGGGGGGSGSATATAAAPATATANRQTKPPRPIDWFMRELPYSYEVLLENLLDPSHLPFSHHGLNPNLQRSGGGPMPMQPPAPAAPPTAAGAPAPAAAAASEPAAPPRHWARPGGPDAEFSFVGNISRDGTLSLHAPHMVSYSYRTGQSDSLIELFATPVAPGRSRFFTYSPGPPPPGAKRPPMPPLSKLSPKLVMTLAGFMLDPVVTHHRFMNKLLDGDSVFLHTQDELLRQLELEAQQQHHQPQQQQPGQPHDANTTSTPATTAATVTTATPDSSGGSSSGGDSSGDGAPDHATSTGGGGGGAGGGGLSWSRLYYMPTQADAAMLAGRRWLEERAGGGPFRARQRQLLAAGGRAAAAAAAGLGAHGGGRAVGGAPTPEERAQLLNRYEQHTRHCPDCRGRLQLLQRAAGAARAAQNACLLLACVTGWALGAALAAAAAAASRDGPAAAIQVLTAGGGWPAAAVVAVAAAWALAAWVARAAPGWAQQFLFVDYVHAEND